MIESVIKHLLARKFIRFLIVSVIATILNFSIFYVLYKFLGVDYRVASGLGFFTGVVLGYFLNSRWTFKDNDQSNPKKQLFKYYFVYTFSLCVNILFMEVAVEYLHIYPTLSNIIAIGVTFCSNYIGTRFWVFKKP